MKMQGQIQGDGRKVTNGLQPLIFSEVVIQQGLKVTVARKEGLEKARLRESQGQGCAQRSWPRT